MYKPPENTNRVRAIKSKFEGRDVVEQSSTKNGLSRQHSDPVKVNIKRSPAFRNDKSFRRDGLQVSCRVRLGGDLKFDDLRRRFDSQEDLSVKTEPRGLGERSNTSAEIVLRDRKCFDSRENLDTSLRKTAVKRLDIAGCERRYENVAPLYTEPVPKSQRNNSERTTNDKLNALTDTLRLALKKPLPKGPAPKKPPRTFAHAPPSPDKKADFEKKLNVALQKNTEVRRRSAKGDPKAMLDKLEHALKMRLQQRQNVVDYTSEEDNCAKTTPSKFALGGCLACSGDEPVYAEPFAHGKDDDKGNVRNSLYYMSTPVTTANEVNLSDGMEDQGLSHSDAGEEMSSLSTPTTTNSDLDSLNSTPSEESKPFRIKDLIKTFERPSDRVDKLGMQLRRTIERGLDGEAERSSVEGDSSDEFRTYVRTIRMFSRHRKRCDDKHLFHCCLLVGLNGRTPYVKFQFPQNVELPSKIEELCFPDSVDSTVDCSVKAQNYSIVLTDDTGERIYGYCRRVLPENSSTCLPLAYCILSKRRAPRFYRKILEELESRHGVPDKVRDVLLDEFYRHRFPSPGESVRIDLTEVNRYTSDITTLDDRRNGGDVDLRPYITGNGVYGTLNKTRNGLPFRNGIIMNEYLDDNEPTSTSTPTELLVTLHQDSRYKETDLEELCGTLRLDILQKVFASLLLERKVVFISALLGKLSTCIEAVQNILYPFSWPHTLIPVVPKDLWEIVEAPTPLICGALNLSVVDEYLIEYGIVVDLDRGEVLKEVGDEGKILPGCLMREFKEGMSLAHSSSREDKSAFNVLLSDAFLRIFVHSCGHYRDFVKDGRFQKEEFVQYPKSKSRRRFLKWFTETTMFHAFMDAVISKTGGFAVFDKRIQIYSAPDSGLILEKMKDWKREKSNLFF